MNKKILFLIVLLLHCFCVLNAQDGSCYSYTRNQGISFYNKGDYNGAKVRFIGAKECPDKPRDNDLDIWINKCNSAMSEKSRQADNQRREETARKNERINAIKGYMDILGIDFKNSCDGVVINPYGSPLQATDIKYLYPRIHYNGLSSQSKKITIYVKLIKPDGTFFSGTSSPDGYTYANDVTIEPGKDKYLYLSGWGNESGKAYNAGNHRIEIWYDGNRLYQQSFILESPKEPQYLKVSSEKVYFHSSGDVFSTDSKSIQVKTNCAYWSVASKPEWCHYTKETGTLNITCDKNYSSSSRNGVIVLTAQGAENASIEIRQLGKSDSSSDYSQKTKTKPVTFGMKVGMITSTFGTSFGETAGSVLNYGYGEDIEKPAYRMGVGFRGGLFIDVRLAKMLYLQPGLFYSYQRTSNKFSNSYNETFDETPSVTGLVTDSYLEKYSTSYLELPILLSFRISLSRKSSLDISVGPYVACALAGVCKFSGSMDAPSLEGSDGNSYKMHADVSGKANLFKPGGSYTRQYTTGAAETFNYEFSNTAAPYKRFDTGLSFGISYEFAWVSLTIGYDLGLMNYANKDFWESERLMVSDYKGATVTDYKQTNQRLQITLGFKFNK